MMTSPFLSVITATRNCASALEITRAALQFQSFRDFEWVIQDCCSDDHSLAVVSDSGMDVSILSESDTGIYDALNRAVRRSRGDWILFLGAGDWLAGSAALSGLVNQLNQTIDLAICNVFEITTSGQIHRRIPDHPATKIELLRDFQNHHQYKFFLESMPCHQGMVTRRKLLEKYPFDCSFRVSADWNQMMRMVNDGCHVAMLDHDLAWYPNGGFSADHSHLWIEDVRRIVAELSQMPELAAQYFEMALDEHTRLYQQRLNLKERIQRFSG